jgi:hypothetical protein
MFGRIKTECSICGKSFKTSNVPGHYLPLDDPQGYCIPTCDLCHRGLGLYIALAKQVNVSAKRKEGTLRDFEKKLMNMS